VKRKAYVKLTDAGRACANSIYQAVFSPSHAAWVRGYTGV